MNLHPYVNHMVQLTLHNGDTLCGVLRSEVSHLKQCTLYYLDGNGSRSHSWYADGVYWKLSKYGKNHGKDVSEISKFEVTLPESYSALKPKIEIKLTVDEASYLHAMMNPNYFLSANEMTDMEREAYNFGLKLKEQLKEFVDKNYIPKE